MDVNWVRAFIILFLSNNLFVLVCMFALVLFCYYFVFVSGRQRVSSFR